MYDITVKCNSYVLHLKNSSFTNSILIQTYYMNLHVIIFINVNVWASI
jgi:hypothetical protein